MIRQIGIFGINQQIVSAAVRGFTVDDWWSRPGGANPAIWILGHIHTYRRILARLLGFEVEPSDFDEHFARGSSPDDVPVAMEGRALGKEFRAFGKSFTAQLEAMDPGTLDEPIETGFANQPATRLGALQFLCMHESYHAGQLGQIRVQLGKGSWMRDD
ncbi:MAG: DinB family protein [Planctomycetota bacterium]